jgi:RimJ/RimL family protein N-acetyltransferase
LLASSPDEPVYTDDAEERTRFTFSTDDRSGAEYYIITDVDRSDPEAIGVTGINYDGRYYNNDSDVINWIDGEPWVDEDLWID